jgi:hypothetical protein
MDFSRHLKRLAIILVLAIIVIFVSKSLLSKAAKNLSREAERKQQAKALKPTAVPVESTPDAVVPLASAPEASLETAPQSSPVAADSPAAGQ